MFEQYVMHDFNSGKLLFKEKCIPERHASSFSRWDIDFKIICSLKVNFMVYYSSENFIEHTQIISE